MGAIWNVTALRYDVPALFDDGTKTKDFLPDIHMIDYITKHEYKYKTFRKWLVIFMALLLY